MTRKRDSDLFNHPFGEKIGPTNSTCAYGITHEMMLKTNLILDWSGPGSTMATLPSGPSREGSEKFATGGKWRNECRETREERNLKRNVAKEEMMIRTWNVRLLRQCGKMEVLVQEMMWFYVTHSLFSWD